MKDKARSEKRDTAGLSVGSVSQLSGSGKTPWSTYFPSYAERKWECSCGKPTERKRLVTKAKKLGKHYEIQGERFALVCPNCGPIAWEAA